MRSEVVEAVERYKQHFSREIEQIRAIAGPSAETFRKVLAVSLLDALSASVMRRPNNRERFVGFVKEFCEWPLGAKLSLPHLAQLLRRNPDPAFSAARLRAFSLLRPWQRPLGNPVYLSEEPDLSDFESLWPRSKEHRQPLEGLTLERLTHYELLWFYRNGLVHELRSVGQGIDFGDELQPHYHQLTTIVSREGPDIESLELVYPSSFLLGLGESGVAGICRYCLANDLDPYASYRFGTYWIAELNA